MPGFTLVYSPQADQHLLDEAVGGLDALRHDDRYDARLLLHTDRLRVGWTAYPSYPLHIAEAGPLWVGLEGHLYDVPAADVGGELVALAGDLLHTDDAAAQRRASAWLQARDTECVLVAVNRHRDEAVLLCDVLGMLPLYRRPLDRLHVISREIGFCTDLPPRPEADRRGIAWYLTLGQPLHDRTVWQDVQRLSPASLVRFTPSRPVRCHVVHAFCFDERDGRPLDHHADILADSFREACRQRATSHDRCIVALSGGLDSRAVAATLHRADVPATSATFVLPNGGSKKEVKIAKDVACRVGFAHDTIPLPPFSLADAHRLLTLKRGFNSLSVSFMLPFLDRVQHLSGPNGLLLTGDGGNVVMADVRPTRSLVDTEALADYLLERYEVIPLADACAAAGVEPDLLRDELIALLESYPEDDAATCYEKFVIEHRIVRRALEGEDRNRAFLWNSAPFYAQPFFAHVVRCPHEYKAYYHLYYAMLQRLAPDALEAGYTNMLGFAFTPARLRAFSAARTMLRPFKGLFEFLKRTLSPPQITGNEATLRRLAIQSFDTCPALHEVLDRDRLDSVLQQDTLPLTTLYTLATISMVFKQHLSCNAAHRFSLQDLL